MDPKTILVHVAPGAGDAAHVRVAAGLARLFDAELIGLGAEAFRPDSDPWLTHLDGIEVAAIRARIDGQLEAARTQFLGCADGVRAAWRTAHEDPDDILVRHAGVADLVVAAAAPSGPNRRVVAEAGDLVLESGLPVLVVPSDHAELELQRVVIGWKNTREARRAVGDALPILKRAEEVHVLSIGAEGGAGAEELADVAARLACHGVTAVTHVSGGSRAGAAEALLDFAQAQRAGLLVVGAYGHSRLREWIFGGVTRDLLRSARLPVLFSR